MKIIDESNAAKALGLKTFTSKTPCVNCGSPERRVASDGCFTCHCLPCSLARSKKYRQDKPDVCKAMQNKWRAENAEYRKAYRKAYYEKTGKQA